MLNEYYLGVDLGGTNVAAALVTPAGQIISRARLKTPRGAEAIAEAVARAAQLALEEAQYTLPVEAVVGVGVPGTVFRSAVVTYACNLELSNVPLADMVASRLDRHVLLENDANAAALGEYVAGAGRRAESLVCVTLGTGVGGGVILDGRLFTGFNSAGAELGHIVIHENGVPCACGRRGCLEAYASATALIRLTRAAMAEHPDSLCWKLAGSPEGVDGRTPFAAARQGDPAAQEVVAAYLDSLACGLVNIVNIFQPQVLCLGGGVANEGAALLGPLQRVLDREDYARTSPMRTRLTLAELGNDAGLIGAALLPRFRTQGRLA